MAYEYEVRRQAKLLSSAVQNACYDRNSIAKLVTNAHSWWRGKGADAFAHAYQEIDKNAARFLQDLDDVAYNLNQLPALIDRAERERREKMQSMQGK